MAKQPTVSSDSVAQDQIRAFIERIERMEEEKKAIADDIKEIYAEAKGNGFDTKVLRQVIRIRNVLSLEGRPRIVDDITLPAALFPGLTEKIFLARDNTIYHLFQSRYGINVLRTDERLRAVLAAGATAALLGVAAGSPLLEIRRVALTFRDRPVELRVSLVNTQAHAYHNTFGKGEGL